MSHQAVVFLTALTPQIYPARRTLVLTPSQPSLIVGRASKSVSKGLVADFDNAWFDSPVMSRSHAEIVFDSDSMSVSVQDTTSMHGTRLNDMDLHSDALYTLSNGDILTFGAEVRRGLEIFQACRFRVEYELTPLESGTGSSTFQVPYSSDIDEQDISGEEDYYGVEDDESEEADTPVEIQPSGVIGVIDLTGDERTSMASPDLQELSQTDAFNDGLVWRNAATESRDIPENKDEMEKEIEESVLEIRDQYAPEEELPKVDESYVDDQDVETHGVDSISDKIDEEATAGVDGDEIPSGQGLPHDFATILNTQESVDYDTNLSYQHTSDETITEVNGVQPNVTAAQPLNGSNAEAEKGGEEVDDDLIIMETATTNPIADLHLTSQEDPSGDSSIKEKTSQLASPITVHHLTGQRWKEVRARPLRERQSYIETAADSLLPPTPIKPSASNDTQQPETLSTNNTRLSPELDMTSAVRFARSKKLVEKNNSSKHRGTKRKANEISKLLEEEKTWEVSSKSATDAKNTIGGKEVHAATSAQTGAEMVTSDVPESSSSDHYRYTKRLKKFAEAAGYAALGGVAVGAGLFSILVATAPDFV